MLLVTYTLQDFNSHDLAVLVYGNQLIRANSKTADKLQDLWVSSKVKDKLRQRNCNLELMSSYARNTNVLDQYLPDNGRDHDLD